MVSNDDEKKLMPLARVTPAAGVPAIELPTRHAGERWERRQPATAPAQGVPVDFDQPITGVHQDPFSELVARTTRTQHITMGIQITLEDRMDAVELATKKLGEGQEAQDKQLTIVVDNQKAFAENQHAVDDKLDKVQLSLDAQDKYLEPLARAASSAITVRHTAEKVEVEIGGAREQNKLDMAKQRRERMTSTLKTVLAILGPLAAAVFGALHLRSC